MGLAEYLRRLSIGLQSLTYVANMAELVTDIPMFLYHKLSQMPVLLLNLVQQLTDRCRLRLE